MRRLRLLLCLPIALIVGSITPPTARPLAYDLAALDYAPAWLDYDLAALGCPPPLAASCHAPTGGGGHRAPAPARPGHAAPAAPAAQGLRLLVSLPQQRLYVYDDGRLVASSPVSTGRRGHATPAGTFRILQKQVFHRSNRYSNAPMPYMQRLTMSGVALHAGHLPGYPASHGCIRMPRSFAKKLYALTSYATTVTITHGRPWQAPARRRWKPRATLLAAR